MVKLHEVTYIKAMVWFQHNHRNVLRVLLQQVSVLLYSWNHIKSNSYTKVVMPKTSAVSKLLAASFILFLDFCSSYKIPLFLYSNLPLLCISLTPHSNKFQAELLFPLLLSFILLNQNPFVSLSVFFCTFLFPWLLLFAMLYTISPSESLSHSLTLFLSFLILLSSLPPFLLLYPAPSSRWLLSLFTFICLSPFSPHQACHSMLRFFVFFSWFLTYGIVKRSSEISFICCPNSSAF